MLARILFFLGGLALVFAPAASAPALAQTSPYEINVILALTGAAAFIGTAEQKSLQLLEASTNKAGGIKGRPVKFVIVDDQSNPQVTVQLANGLIAKKRAGHSRPDVHGDVSCGRTARQSRSG